MNNISQAVILCGGYGSRINKITKYRAKPLIKYYNRNFIEYLIFFLSKYRFREVLLLTHYKSKLFKKLYDKKTIFGLKLKCVSSKEKLGTGGSLKYAEKYLKNYFFLCNGDTIFNQDITNFISGAEKKNIVTTAYGQEELTKKIKSSGNYIINKIKLFKVINFINKKKFSLESDVIPLIKKQKKKYYKNFFLDIGSYRSLNFAKLWIKKKVFSKFAIFDRDGVFNIDTGYVHNKQKFIWNKNIFSLLKYLKKKNYLIFIVTNQSGIGRQFFTINQFNNLNNWMLNF